MVQTWRLLGANQGHATSWVISKGGTRLSKFDILTLIHIESQGPVFLVQEKQTKFLSLKMVMKYSHVFYYSLKYAHLDIWLILNDFHLYKVNLDNFLQCAMSNTSYLYIIALCTKKIAALRGPFHMYCGVLQPKRVWPSYAKKIPKEYQKVQKMSSRNTKK